MQLHFQKRRWRKGGWVKMIEVLPFTEKRYDEVMSYDNFKDKEWAQGYSENELKALTDYLTLSEMNSIVNRQPSFSFIKKIWNINYKHHTIVTPDQIHYDVPRSSSTPLCGGKYRSFLLNIIEPGYPCVLRSINNHLVLQSLDEYDDIIAEEEVDHAYDNFQIRQLIELEIGGFCFAEE